MVLLVVGPSGRRDPSWPEVAAPLLVVSGAVVLMSLAVTVAAWRLQLAAPGSAPIAALQWFDVSSERNVPTAWSTLLLPCAVVLETVSGQVLRAYGAGGKACTLVTSVEEGLEMAGASLLLAALLVQLRQAKPGRNSLSTGRTSTSASS